MTKISRYRSELDQKNFGSLSSWDVGKATQPVAGEKPDTTQGVENEDQSVKQSHIEKGPNRFNGKSYEVVSAYCCVKKSKSVGLLNSSQQL